MVDVEYRVSRSCICVEVREVSDGARASRDEHNGSPPANGQDVKMCNSQSGESYAHTEHLSMVFVPVIEKQSRSHSAIMILVRLVFTQALHVGCGGLHIGAMCSSASVRMVSVW